LLDALDEWKPGLDKNVMSPASYSTSEMSKVALGPARSSANQTEAERMAKVAFDLKKSGKLHDAADLMEEAFNKWPELRERYASQVKLWRCGISM
jgi:hypothetical protein